MEKIGIGCTSTVGFTDKNTLSLQPALHKAIRVITEGVMQIQCEADFVHCYCPMRASCSDYAAENSNVKAVG